MTKLYLSLFILCLIYVNPACAEVPQANAKKGPQETKAGDVQKEFPSQQVDAQKEFPGMKIDEQKEFPSQQVDAQKEFHGMKVDAKKDFSNS